MDKKQRDFIAYQMFVNSDNSNNSNNSGGSNMGCGTYLIIIVALALIGSCMGL